MADIDATTVSLTSKNPADFHDVGRAADILVHGTMLVPPGTRDVVGGAVLLGAGHEARTVRALGAVLAGAGRAVLAVDSAHGRSVRRFGRAVRLSEAAMVADAFAAAGFLASEAQVPMERISLIGLGAAGTASVLAAYVQVAALFGGRRFARHAAICAPASLRVEDYRTTGAPVVFATTAAHAATKAQGLLVGDLENGGSSVEKRALPQNDGVGGPQTLPGLRLTPDNRLLSAVSGRVVTGRLGRAAILATRRGRVHAPAMPSLDMARLVSLLVP